MPHLTRTRAAAHGNNGGDHASAPDVDPQDRIDWVFANLGTRSGGLTGREAQRRLDQFGLNEITRTQKSSRLGELARQTDLAIVMREQSTWEPLDEVPPSAHLALRTDRPVEQITADVLALLDRHLVALA